MVYFLHLVDLYGKCRYINLPVPWMLWVCNSIDQLHGKMPHYTKYRHYDFRCFSTWTNLYDLLYYPLSVKGELVGGTRNMQIHVLNARGKTLVVNHITFSHHQGLWWFWWAELWYRNPKWKVIKPSGSCQTNDADIMNRTWVFQVSLSWWWWWWWWWWCWLMMNIMRMYYVWCMTYDVCWWYCESWLWYCWWWRRR